MNVRIYFHVVKWTPHFFQQEILWNLANTEITLNHLKSVSLKDQLNPKATMSFSQG